MNRRAPDRIYQGDPIPQENRPLYQIPDTVGIRNRVRIPLLDGEASGLFVSFTGFAPGEEHCAIALGSPPELPLVRVHSECITGDVFGSQLCDCGHQLREDPYLGPVV